MEQFSVSRYAFETAISSSPTEMHELYFCLAGRKVHLRVIGTSLFRILEEAFCHLTTDNLYPGKSDLKIDLWDEQMTGVPFPIDDPGAHYSVNGQIQKNDDGTIISHYRPQMYCTMNRKTNRIIGSSKGPQYMSIYDKGKPLLTLLGIWLADIGRPLLHGGLVAKESKGILLGGIGGSGKSTTAVACLIAGWDYLGDDAIAIERFDGNTFVAHSLYGSTTIEPEHMHNFNPLVRHSITGNGPGEDKGLVLLRRLFPDQIKNSARIVALVAPSVTPKPNTGFYPIRKLDALLALAPSSVLRLPNPGESYLNLLADLTASVPCFRLDLGSDIERIPDFISMILDQSRSL